MAQIDVFSQVAWSLCFPPLLLLFLFLISTFHLFSQLDGLVTDRESLPERSKEIRERLRGKGLPSGKKSCTDRDTEQRACTAVNVCTFMCVHVNTFLCYETIKDKHLISLLSCHSHFSFFLCLLALIDYWYCTYKTSRNLHKKGKFRNPIWKVQLCKPGSYRQSTYS